MKVTFFERLGAYIIDFIIINLIFSIITLGLGNTTSKSEELLNDLSEQFMNQEITAEVYLEEYQNTLYDYQKENVLETGLSVAVTIAYFVVFQYMNKGRTIGKQLLKIKVVDKDTEKPISILKGLLRELIIYSILSGTLFLILLYILNPNSYILTYGAILLLEGIFTLTTIILVLYRKDGRGLHDMMTNTIVVRESR